MYSRVASPKGPGGPRPHQFLRLLKVKSYVGNHFLLTRWPIIDDSCQFQKCDYTLAYNQCCYGSEKRVLFKSICDIMAD